MIIERGELRIGSNPANLDSDNKELRAKNNPVNHENSDSGDKELRIRHNSESIVNQGPDKVNTERLKFIDDIFRIISELKKQFPELAQNLEKARDNIPTNIESHSAKNLIEIFNTIKQILNKPETQEIIRNLINEAIKILQPSVEIPPENKLILALLKNDFASANIAIKNIVEQNLPQTAQQPVPQQQITLPQQQPTLQQTQYAQIPNLSQTTTLQSQNSFNSFQTFQIILNAMQEIKTLGLPQELQNAPLKELEAIILQKTGIEIPKNLVKNLSAIFNEKPVFAVSNFVTSNIKTENAAINYIRIEVAPPVNSKSQQSNPVHTFEIPLPKNFPQAFSQNMQIPENAQNSQITQNTQNMQELQIPQKQELAFSLYKIIVPQQSETKFVLQAWPASIHIPKEERAFWLKIELPLTPQILNLRDTLLSFGKLPENPAVVKLFAESLHEMSLLSENGKSLEKEQISLLYRFIQASNQTSQPATPFPMQLATPPSEQPATPFPMQLATPPSEQPATPYPMQLATPPSEQPATPYPMQLATPPSEQPATPYPMRLATPPSEQPATLFPMQLATLPSEQPATPSPMRLATQIFSHIPQHVIQTLLKYQPHENYEGELFKNLPEPLKKEILKELPTGKIWQPEILQQAIERIKPNEEHRQILQNFKEQIQWTRIDQDTRQPQDRENVFYFMHNSELQKGRLRVKDERKSGGKKQQGSSISFSIKTKTKNLGDVNVDLTLSKRILNIRMQDSIGKADKAVENERETLAKELADIGISLGELLYGKTPKIRNLPIAKAKERNNGFDVRA